MNEVMNTAQESPVMMVQDNTDALMSMDYDNIIAVAEKADRLVNAMNKIMQAAIKITTPKDWTMIGGVPYLQESGASKVARIFGICWKIYEGYPRKEIDSEGYPTFYYKMKFRLGSQEIDAEGMRSGKDPFFTGTKDKKGPDEIDWGNVQRAAYTNCLNRGIKTILPGLRNLDAQTLEAAGMNVGAMSGYSFKTGSRGGNSGKAEDSGHVCSNCGAAIAGKVASYSESKYGRKLCYDCQKLAKEGKLEKTDEDRIKEDFEAASQEEFTEDGWGQYGI